MKPILFLAPRLPLPADTGAKIRTLNLLRQLRQAFELHLVCFSDGPQDSERAMALRSEGIEVTLVPMPPAALAYWNAIVPGRPPVTVAKYTSPRMARTLTTLARARAYGAVHCDHVHMAQYQQRIPDLPWVLDEHNVEHQILDRLAQVQENPLRRWLVANQAARMRTFERDAVSRATRVLAVSQADADALRGLDGDTPIDVVPNGVDTSYFDCSPLNPESADLVFTGSMDWWPNEDAAIFFARDVFPRIRAARPDARFLIVGRAPSAVVRSLATEDGSVVVTGAVDDVRPYLHQAAAVVVPIRVAGGTRLKILEAMAAGRPVIATSIGAEGIECVPDRHLAIATAPPELAAVSLELLSDPSRAAQLAREARRLVVERYAWSAVGQHLMYAYRTIASVATTPAD
jgi:sugar transferase (PEP-CTERM/EpsH1 system associated)